MITIHLFWSYNSMSTLVTKEKGLKKVKEMPFSNRKIGREIKSFKNK